MTDFFKLVKELAWDPTDFYEKFNPPCVDYKELRTKLRMGLVRASVTIDIQCSCIQDKTFLQMKDDLRRVLLEYPDRKTLEGLLTTWIKYLKDTKTSIHSETLRDIRFYFLDLQAELKRRKKLEGGDPMS